MGFKIQPLHANCRPTLLFILQHACFMIVRLSLHYGLSCCPDCPADPGMTQGYGYKFSLYSKTSILVKWSHFCPTSNSSRSLR